MPAAPFEPFFLPVDGANPGHRFCIYHPAQGEATHGAILYIHPFAEEMNKSRRMAALQSRAFAKAGYAVLQIDLLGCGDSSGDFGDATWDDWVADVQRGANWLAQRTSAPLWLWGLRAGCLLAVEAARSLPALPNFLFWSPTVSGKQVLQQFLRLKAAAELAGGNAKAILDALRADLAQGRPVEIAGYSVSARLASGLEQASLDAIAATATDDRRRLEWLELSTRDDAELSPVAQKALSSWTQAGWSAARGQVVQGPAFWQTTEIEDAPGLLDATMASVVGSGPAFCPPGAGQAAGLDPREQAADPTEQAVTFECAGETLVGILTAPQTEGSAADCTTGVIVIVGGPQYRAGSHRQFVQLARAVAAAGYPVLRFDYRGMGDSTGELRDFQQVTPDIAAAIDTLQRQVPSVKHIVLWGLCDAASAALLYCHDTQDARVRGLCLLNPWVRSEASLARAHVKHYYVDRLRQSDFWRKLLSGKVAWSAIHGLWRNLRTAIAGGESAAGNADSSLPYQDRMAQAWQTTALPIQLLLSGEDYTAKEFVEYAAMNPAWQGLLDLPHVSRQDIAGADHTLSTGDTQQAAESLTLRWLNGLASGATPQPTPR